MPLIKSGSKKAFSKNVEKEMSAGKPMNQSLAIAYDVKKRNAKKKMAKGGMVNESAKTEMRPMPSERDQDSKMVSRNSSMKAASQDQMLDQPTVAQAQKPSITPLSRPKMANGMYKVRDRDDVLKEEMMMSKMPPDGYGKQPDKEYDEEGAKRQGPSVPALKMKMMAEGGMINKAVSIKAADEDMEQHPEGLESDDDQMRPSEDEIMADHFAEGGMAEMDEDHQDSIAAAIMARKDRQMRLDSDSDEDRMEMMAEGGYINGEDSIYSDDSSQADLARNAEEDKNMEDQSSYDALRKENYSESEGLRKLDSPMDSNEHGHDLDDEDSHDMVSSIRSKMNMKRQFKVR